MDIPIFEVNEDELLNIIPYLLKRQKILKEFGAIKIQANLHCQISLLKRRKNLHQSSPIKEILRKTNTNGIYIVENVEHIEENCEENLLNKSKDEFWSSLSSLDWNKKVLNISSIYNQ